MALPRNPFLQLVFQRLDRTRRFVDPQVWERRQTLSVFGGPVNEEALPLRDGMRQTMKPVRAGDYFGPPNGGWKQRWFKVQVPAAQPDERGRRVLFWRCHGEATVFLDGTAWAGLDIAHNYCPLPDKAVTLWIDVATHQTGIWMPYLTSKPDQYGCRFDEAYVACRNEDAWHVKYDIDVLAIVADRFMTEAQRDVDASTRFAHFVRMPPFLRRLMTDIDTALNAYDQGLPALRKALAKVYANHPAEYWQPAYTMVGQAHLDLVWLWPESASWHKCVHTTATVLQLFKRYPEFRFIWSQPAMFDMIRLQDPKLYDRMTKEIRAGRLEATGAMEVEFDSQVPCGEALARSLAYGQRRLAAIRGGKLSKGVWIPDSFGFTQCLPQLMNLAGVPYFYTSKIAWNHLVRFPYDSFVWKSPDGSSVVAHSSLPLAITFEAFHLTDSARTYEQAGVHNEVFRGVGHCDGGGGPDEETLERARRFANLVGYPKARWDSVEKFFDRLARVRKDLPEYQGELYLELHRGCATSQANFKLFYRRGEKALQAHEAVRAVLGSKPLGFEAWRRVLFAQFHDALPGSSIGLVYEQMNPELEKIGLDHLAAASGDLAHGGPRAPLAAVNPLPLPRQTPVALSAAEVASLPKDTPLQRTGSGAKAGALAVLTLPPTGAVSVADAAVDTSATRWTVSPRTLDNGLVRADFDARGQLTGLRIDGQDLLLSAPAGLMLYPEILADAWELDRSTLLLGKPAAEELALRVVERGPARATLRGEAKIGRTSRITLDFILEAGSPYLRIEADVDWREPEGTLLKYHLRTAHLARFARYGCPFGSVQRQQVGGHITDEAKWEVYGSRWAALTDEAGSRGLTILTEAKYGFGTRDGDFSVSLLRASKDPDTNADRGRHHIRFAVGAWQTTTDTTDGSLSTAAAAEALFAPVVLARTSQPPASLFSWSDLGTLLPSWVLPAEDSDGYILRLHETVGGRGTATLRLASPARSVRLVDLLERPLPADQRAACRKIDASCWEIDYTPYQILSLHVQPTARLAGKKKAAARKTAARKKAAGRKSPKKAAKPAKKAVRGAKKPTKKKGKR